MGTQTRRILANFTDARTKGNEEGGRKIYPETLEKRRMKFRPQSGRAH
jgi:hypothetical protein